MPHNLSPFSFQFSPPPARHYHSTLSIWLSVDPMSDKYPSMSPYTYCGNNPVVLKDPDGRTVVIPDEDDQNFISQLIDPQSEDYSKDFSEVYNVLKSDPNHTFVFQSWKGDPQNKERGKIEFNNEKKSWMINFTKENSETDAITGISKYKYIFEETYHGFQLINGQLTGTCISESLAWKFSAKAPGTIFRTPDGYFQTKTFMAYVRDAPISELAIILKIGLYKNSTYIGTRPLYPSFPLGTKLEMLLYYPQPAERHVLSMGLN
ncbi:MAG: hypothetical protein K6A95_06775 [Bacteroidales bacterium]|nr:hypothetical protein [Bacteroidales bacterium]